MTPKVLWEIVKRAHRVLGWAVNCWQISGSVLWHSGIPFSVLSAPYSANGNGIVNGSGPQFASAVPCVPLYEHNPIPGLTQPGSIQWLNPNAFVSAIDPSTGDSELSLIRRHLQPVFSALAWEETARRA